MVGAVWAALAGCAGTPEEKAASGGSAPTPSARAEVGHLDAPGARDLIAARSDALILDVRNPDEWDNELGHIAGARQIPLPELTARIAEIDGWKEKPVVVVCRSGRRSLEAAQILAGSGFKQVSNLEGGMLAWRAMAAGSK
jgi:rhodanese-related sulfurtransferase